MTALSELSIPERHRTVTADFTGLVDRVADWDAPAPVADWDAREVVRHLVEWLPGMLAGGSPVRLEVAASVDDDPVASWRQLSEQVQSLLDDPATSGLTYRSQMFDDMSVPAVIDQFWTPDVYMHSWDLARASGQQIDLDPQFATGLRTGMEQMGPALRESGQFGEQQPIPDDADEIDRLIAFIGRNPRWTPAGADSAE